LSPEHAKSGAMTAYAFLLLAVAAATAFAVLKRRIDRLDI